jgi:hypothetical protein
MREQNMSPGNPDMTQLTPTSPNLLSSQQTFLMKIVFPVIWIGAFAVGTLGLFLWSGSFQGPRQQPPEELKWFFLAMTCAGTVFIWWSCMRLKRVGMDDKALYISNFFTEIVVPLNNVAEVTENRWINIHPVPIFFRSDTAFGSRIVFMPKPRWFALWSSHPVVDEIRNAVARATGAAPA